MDKQANVAAGQRIVPGTYWYAYGSVAFDMTGDAGAARRARVLRVVDGGVRSSVVSPRQRDGAVSLNGRSTRTSGCVGLEDARVRMDECAHPERRGRAVEGCRTIEGSARCSQYTVACSHRATGTAGHEAERRAAARFLAVAAAFLVVVVLGGFVGAVALGAASGRAPVSVPTESISVAPGDSLWSISEIHPIEGLSTQECVAWIMEANGLSDATLVPGQVIEVPRAAARF